MIFQGKLCILETLDFERTVLEGFFELSKTERDLSSPNVILTNGIRVIRQLKLTLARSVTFY